jgi:hypothetical protein
MLPLFMDNAADRARADKQSSAAGAIFRLV